MKRRINDVRQSHLYLRYRALSSSVTPPSNFSRAWYRLKPSIKPITRILLFILAIFDPISGVDINPQSATMTQSTPRNLCRGPHLFREVGFVFWPPARPASTVLQPNARVAALDCPHLVHGTRKDLGC